MVDDGQDDGTGCAGVGGAVRLFLPVRYPLPGLFLRMGFSSSSSWSHDGGHQLRTDVVPKSGARQSCATFATKGGYPSGTGSRLSPSRRRYRQSKGQIRRTCRSTEPGVAYRTCRQAAVAAWRAPWTWTWTWTGTWTTAAVADRQS